MRKAVALLLLTAFVVASLAAPALAAQGGQNQVAPPLYQPKPVTVVGWVRFSQTGGPHYELWEDMPLYAPPLPGLNTRPKIIPPRVYILTGPFKFDAYKGKKVVVTGYEYSGPYPYQKGPVSPAAQINAPKPAASAPPCGGPVLFVTRIKPVG